MEHEKQSGASWEITRDCLSKGSSGDLVVWLTQALDKSTFQTHSLLSNQVTQSCSVQ